MQKITTLQNGYSEVDYEGKKYSETKTNFNAGNSIKVYAKELGGNHFISFNYYQTSHSNLLKPCEMPREAVIHFLENFDLIAK